MEIQDDLIISPEQQRAFDSVTCGVCSRWALDPILIACKVPHVGYTCEPCLQAQYESADAVLRNKCPECRSRLIEVGQRIQDPLRNIMRESLFVFCTNRRPMEGVEWEGCKLKVSLARMTQHWTECKYFVRACKFSFNGCEEVGIKMEEHEKICPREPANCMFARNGCTLMNVFKEALIPHEKECRFDGVLTAGHLGVMGVAVFSCEDRLKVKGTKARKLIVNEHELIVWVTESE